MAPPSTQPRSSQRVFSYGAGETDLFSPLANSQGVCYFWNSVERSHLRPEKITRKGDQPNPAEAIAG
jgi:hypothetical protein